MVHLYLVFTYILTYILNQNPALSQNIEYLKIQ